MYNKCFQHTFRASLKLYAQKTDSSLLSHTHTHTKIFYWWFLFLLYWTYFFCQLLITDTHFRFHLMYMQTHTRAGSLLFCYYYRRGEREKYIYIYRYYINNFIANEKIDKDEIRYFVCVRWKYEKVIVIKGTYTKDSEREKFIIIYYFILMLWWKLFGNHFIWGWKQMLKIITNWVSLNISIICWKKQKFWMNFIYF